MSIMSIHIGAVFSALLIDAEFSAFSPNLGITALNTVS